jgi:hypothetical protein
MNFGYNNQKYSYIIPIVCIIFGLIFTLRANNLNKTISESQDTNSRMTLATKEISGLECNPKASTVLITWNKINIEGKHILGYNIYRRKDENKFQEPIAYTGKKPYYIDSRLEMNTIYYYKIRARDSEYNEVGESKEIKIKTKASDSKYYKFANLKIAVLIYQNTNFGSISDSELNKIKSMIKVAKKFIWRNSMMNLNIELNYYPIKSRIDVNNQTEFPIDIAINDLKDKGVMSTQYDILFRIAPPNTGYWSIGARHKLGMLGPDRSIGFSQSQWPVSTGVVYPGHKRGLDYGMTWIFLHEVQHAIDDLYFQNKQPEMAHGDLPENFDIQSGPHFNYQANIFRDFKNYLELNSKWGDIYESVDNDQDGFPDNEPIVAMDENRFGSSTEMLDTDADNYPDSKEFYDGIYQGSDPNNSDTDYDGIIDGNDPYVRYPVKLIIPQFTPVIDGNIENGWKQVYDTISYSRIPFEPIIYMAYNPDSLYIGLKLPDTGIPEFRFDFDSDGWYHGRGNTLAKVHLPTSSFSTFRSRDATQQAKQLTEANIGIWDNREKYLDFFDKRVMYPQEIHLEVNLSDYPRIEIEFAISKNAYAGLELQPGDSLGLNINYNEVNNNRHLWASTFDKYSFVYFTLSQNTKVQQHKVDNKMNNLLSNYPNPFNSKTIIKYKLTRNSNVILEIYNIKGQKIKTLVSEKQNKGLYKILWNGLDSSGKKVGSGIYYYRIITNYLADCKKMVLLR